MNKYQFRLNKLANELAKLPEDKFNFAYFVHGKCEGNNSNLKPSKECGTTCCALGLAATMPFFRQLGLRVALVNNNKLVVLDSLINYDILNEFRHNRVITRLSGNKIFGIDESEYDYLFIPKVENEAEYCDDCPCTDSMCGLEHFSNKDFNPKNSMSIYCSAKDLSNHILSFIERKDPSSYSEIHPDMYYNYFSDE